MLQKIIRRDVETISSLPIRSPNSRPLSQPLLRDLGRIHIRGGRDQADALVSGIFVERKNGNPSHPIDNRIWVGRNLSASFEGSARYPFYLGHLALNANIR